MSEPRCKECDCVTGGAEHCYEHKPYMVYPKADGSFVSDRYGRKNIWFDEPPAPEAPILSAIRALVQQWREQAIRLHRDGNERDHVRESQSYCYGQEHAYQ